MSPPAAWASVAVGVLALAWGVTAWLLRQALAGARHQGVADTERHALARDLASLSANSQEQLRLLRSEMRDDRRATNDRLRYLEENLWKTLSRGRSPTAGH
jgi:hypothetical protein